MPSVKVKRANSWSSYEKYECSAESVIKELTEKMNQLKFRLLDCQNKNQMLRKELLLAKKVIDTEVIKAPDEKFQDLLNQTDFRGRQENILILKDKLNELQNRIKELEDGSTTNSTAEDLPKSSKTDKLEKHKVLQNKKMMDKELQYLLENSCQLKRKLEVWKKRSAELVKETELLRLELNRLLEKSKEDKNVHESYLVIEKELRARQSEKLDMRSKLDLEKTRNEQLSEELAALNEDLSMILNKTNDDKVLIDALKNQQGCLIDLLERQKLISESDNRKFQDDMREIQTKHATNNHVLDHLKDIVKEKTQKCHQIQQQLKDVIIVDEKEEKDSSIITTTDTDQLPRSESQQSTIPANDLPSENGEIPDENEKMKLKEEVEQHKNIFQSINEEIQQLTHIILSNNNKTDEWLAQLFQTSTLLAQKNAEIHDLELTLKKLQKTSSVNKKDSESTSQGPNFIEEMQKKYDALREEYQFLLALWDLLISNKENSLEVFFVSTEFARKKFTDAVFNFIATDDNSSINEEPRETEELESLVF